MLFLKAHQVRLEQEVLATDLLHLFEEVFQLLRELLNGDQIFPFVGGLQFLF